MGSSGSGTTVNKTEPPAYAIPYHESLLRRAGGVAGQPYTPYPYARIADFSPEQEEGLQATANRARAGSPVMQAAQGNLTDTLQGKYLDSNPYVDSMVKRSQDDVLTRYGAQLGRNFGNSGVNETVSRAAMDAGNAVRYANYGDERNRQMQANLFAPSAAAADYADAQALMGVGDVRQGQQQNLLNFGYDEFQRAMGYPYQQLDTLSSALNATGGFGTQTAPNPYQSSKAAGALGGAASGAAIGSMFGPGYGTAIGAGVGGLAGLLL